MNPGLQSLRASWLLDQVSSRHSQRHIIKTSANNGSQSTTRCRIVGNRLLILTDKKIACIFIVRSLLFLLLQKHGVISLCVVQRLVKGTTAFGMHSKPHYVRSMSLLKHGSVLHFLHKFSPS